MILYHLLLILPFFFLPLTMPILYYLLIIVVWAYGHYGSPRGTTLWGLTPRELNPQGGVTSQGLTSWGLTSGGLNPLGG